MQHVGRGVHLAENNSGFDDGERGIGGLENRVVHQTLSVAVTTVDGEG
jgi:hypothetical protein